MATLTGPTAKTDGEETIETPVTSRFATADFWLEMVIKQGPPAVIALWLVYSMSTRQEQAIKSLSDNIANLSQRIDNLSRMEKIR